MKKNFYVKQGIDWMIDRECAELTNRWLLTSHFSYVLIKSTQLFHINSPYFLFYFSFFYIYIYIYFKWTTSKLCSLFGLYDSYQEIEIKILKFKKKKKKHQKKEKKFISSTTYRKAQPSHIW